MSVAAFLKEARSAPPGPDDAANERLLALMAVKHGVTLAMAREQLLDAAVDFHAVKWSDGLSSDVYREQYAIRNGRCVLWGVMVFVLGGAE